MNRTQFFMCVSLIIAVVAVVGFAIGWYAHKDVHQEESRWCMFAENAVTHVDNS